MSSVFNKFFYIAIVFIILSVICFVAPGSFILPIIYDFVCAIIVLIGAIKLLYVKFDYEFDRDSIFDLIEGIINIAVGIVCINSFQYYIICLTMCIIFLVVPIIRLVTAHNKKNQLILDTFKFIFAGLIITSIKTAPVIGKTYAGIVFLILGLGLLGIKIYYYNTGRYLK